MRGYKELRDEMKREPHEFKPSAGEKKEVPHKFKPMYETEEQSKVACWISIVVAVVVLTIVAVLKLR